VGTERKKRETEEDYHRLHRPEDYTDGKRRRY
jgi:hypothetical protein